MILLRKNGDLVGGVDSAIELMEGAMGENGRGLSLGIFWRVALAVAMPKWLIYNEEGCGNHIT